MYGHIFHSIERPSPDVLKKFEGIWTSTLADTMGRHGVMMPEIRPLFDGARLLGSALTVLNYPNDNITTHKALLMARPGDVLVIDEGGDNNTGAFGHNMSLQARNRGVVGIVTNGCIRDAALLRSERFPAFCRGICARSAQKNTPGSINVPVQDGGIVVSPGDVVVGDDDGIAVVPRAALQDVLDRAIARMDMEWEQAADIKAGKAPLEILFGGNWVNAALAGKVTEHPETTQPNRDDT